MKQSLNILIRNSRISTLLTIVVIAISGLVSFVPYEQSLSFETLDLTELTFDRIPENQKAFMIGLFDGHISTPVECRALSFAQNGHMIYDFWMQSYLTSYCQDSFDIEILDTVHKVHRTSSYSDEDEWVDFI